MRKIDQHERFQHALAPFGTKSSKTLMLTWFFNHPLHIFQSSSIYMSLNIVFVLIVENMCIFSRENLLHFGFLTGFHRMVSLQYMKITFLSKVMNRTNLAEKNNSLTIYDKYMYCIIKLAVYKHFNQEAKQSLYKSNRFY